MSTDKMLSSSEIETKKNEDVLIEQYRERTKCMYQKKKSNNQWQPFQALSQDAVSVSTNGNDIQQNVAESSEVPLGTSADVPK